MQPEIAVFLLGHNIGRAIFVVHYGRIIAAHDGALVHRIGHDLPFDGHLGSKTGSLPVDPVFMQGFLAAVKQHLCPCGGFGPQSYGVLITGIAYKQGDYERKKAQGFHRFGFLVLWVK